MPDKPKPTALDHSLRDTVDIYFLTPQHAHRTVTAEMWPHIRHLGDPLDILDRHAGDIQAAAAECLAAYRATGRHVWNNRAKRVLTADELAAIWEYTFEDHVRSEWARMFTRRPQREIAAAAMLTERLTPAQIWPLIAQHRRARQACEQRPSDPGALVTEAAARAAALKLALDTIQAHFAAFLKDPTQEPA